MECRRAEQNNYAVSRYSVSFQDHITEVTPLLPPVAIKQPNCSGGSLSNLKNCWSTSNGATPRSCRTPYDSDENDSECDYVVNNCTDNSDINLSVNNAEPSISRSFSEGTAILKYSSNSEVDKPIRYCTHGNSYDECCGKNGGPNNGAGDSHSSSNSPSTHCHTNEPPYVDLKARRRLIIASILCVCFMAGEVAGGYLAGSLAIMTDAAHLLTDFASFMISLFALWVATRPSSRRMNFGWYRAEVVGALTSVLLIWVVTGILVYLAVQRIVNKTYEIEATIMLITSGVGVAVNIVMGLVLQGHGHSHGGSKDHGHGHSHGDKKHSHSHSHDAHQEEAGTGSSHNHAHAVNINVRAAFIHVIGDFLQSIGVFIAALIIYFKPAWGIVDPICTFLFSILVLVTTIAIMKDTLTVLMEGLPKGVDFNDVHKTFFIIDGVVQVHNLRIWSLSMDKIALSAHVVVAPGTDPQDVLKKASQLVRQKYSFFEMTLQIEDLKEDMNNCKECQTPE